ncbi:MAG: 30S ribosomal protein S8 [Patescibacteria group bacterium]
MYYNLLPKIKNGFRARKESITVPFSRMDFAVSKVLENGGYIREVEKRMVGKKAFLDIVLVYKKKEPTMSDFKIISKPSRHMYKGYREIRPVKQGYGTTILSTPKGIMTEKDARKQKVGGEHLFDIW